MATHPIRVLSLCSGYGGLDLAVRRVFPESRTICYVERETSCVRILAARMADRKIEPAPIWDDVSTFNGRRWAGCVDLIVAGFPCQPHSQAGKQQGVDDPRWEVWDDIVRIAKECSARSVFLENVPGLLKSSGGQSIRRIESDLRALGLSARIRGERVDSLGGFFRGSRVFILAQTDGYRLPWFERQWSETRDQRGSGSAILPDQGGVWTRNALPEPCLFGGANGAPERMDRDTRDRIRALGNGVVPLQAAAALTHLIGALHD